MDKPKLMFFDRVQHSLLAVLMMAPVCLWSQGLPQGYLNLPDPDRAPPIPTMPSMSALGQAQCDAKTPEEMQVFLARFASKADFRESRTIYPLRLVSRAQLAGSQQPQTALASQTLPGVEILSQRQVAARTADVFAPLLSQQTLKSTTVFNHRGFDLEARGSVAGNSHTLAVYRFVLKQNCWVLGAVERG